MSESRTGERKFDPDSCGALLFDLDGTLIPSEKYGMPSAELRMALQEARVKRGMRYSIVTGRPGWLAMPQINFLDIQDPCVVNGGCEIINPISGEVLYSQSMTAESQMKAFDICKAYGIPLFDNKNQYGGQGGNGKPIKRKWRISGKNNKLFVEGLDHTTAESLMWELNRIPNLAALSSTSFRGEGFYDIHMTHTRGTKAEGVTTLIDMMDLTPDQVMAFGDSHNDLPLFAAVSGGSIAVGNAPPNIQEAADFVTGRQEHDGVAHFLRSHVLSSAGIRLDRAAE